VVRWDINPGSHTLQPYPDGEIGRLGDGANPTLNRQIVLSEAVLVIATVLSRTPQRSPAC
jgi:hypothetical protein